MALFAGLVLRKSVVLELTLFGKDDAVTLTTRSAFGRIGCWLTRRLLLAARRIVCNSPLLERSCHQIGIAPSRIWQRANPVDTTEFQPPVGADAQREIRARLNLPPKAPVAIMVGRLCERKNQAYWPEVLAHTKGGHHLVLLGPTKSEGDVRYVAEIRARVATLGLGHRVTIVDGMCFEIDRWLKAADVFVFASHAEGCPNAVLEALCSGLPVVGVDHIETLTDHVLDEDGRIFDAGVDTQRVADAVDGQDTGFESRHERAQRAHRRYAMKDAGRHYCRLYQAVASSAETPSTGSGAVG